MGNKYIDPPVPIMVVLNHALASFKADGRFRSVPNGHIEIAWRQPAKGRDGEGPRPGRYCITIECMFQPGATE